MKVEKKVHSTFFAEGAHSLDSTGEQSEADFPLYVQLFEDYFTWKASSLPGCVRERDIHLRDQRHHHSHLIVGTQVSLLCLFYFFCPFILHYGPFLSNLAVPCVIACGCVLETELYSATRCAQHMWKPAACGTQTNPENRFISRQQQEYLGF
jgi:hypothetical protein